MSFENYDDKYIVYLDCVSVDLNIWNLSVAISDMLHASRCADHIASIYSALGCILQMCVCVIPCTGLHVFII